MTQYYADNGAVANPAFKRTINIPTEVTVNISINNTGTSAGTITLTIFSNSQGVSTYSVNSGTNFELQDVPCNIIGLSSTTTAAFAIVVSGPEFIPPTNLTISTGTVTVAGTVNTDVGQGTQIAGNTTLDVSGTAIDPRQIRALNSSDTPNKSWTLNNTDQPDITVNQTAAFGSSGKPVYIRLLTGSDVPGRGWTLGTSDTPVIADAAGNKYGQSFTNGGAAPATGTLHFNWKYGTLASSLSINGNTILNLGTVQAGSVDNINYTVKAGTTYTIADNGSPAGTMLEGYVGP